MQIRRRRMEEPSQLWDARRTWRLARREREEPVVADEVETARIGDSGRVFPVRERPEPTACADVECEGPLAQRRYVDDPAHDRGTAGDRAGGIERPAPPAGRRVECVEPPVVRPDEHEVVDER